jgi:hypothetical protein
MSGGNLDPRTLILIWDKSASFGLSPFHNDFIDYVECLGHYLVLFGSLVGQFGSFVGHFLSLEIFPDPNFALITVEAFIVYYLNYYPAIWKVNPLILSKTITLTLAQVLMDQAGMIMASSKI